MELFTLIIWLWMGARFEETQIPNMGRGECVERLMTQPVMPCATSARQASNSRFQVSSMRTAPSK